VLADTTTAELARLVDRAAVGDVVRRYFELVDLKDWTRFDEVLTEDTAARWSADRVVRGRAALVEATRHMIGSEEIVTFHHVAGLSPVVDGDHASVTARVRAMHYGLGPRQGLFYESLAVQPTELVRTPDGWRISAHEWQILVRLGDLGELFAPELAAGRKH
jgi:hypothetical protein